MCANWIICRYFIQASLSSKLHITLQWTLQWHYMNILASRITGNFTVCSTSDNGLAPGRQQTITSINYGVSLLYIHIWKFFLYHWPFIWGIHLCFCVFLAWISIWPNSRSTGDLRCLNAMRCQSNEYHVIMQKLRSFYLLFSHEHFRFYFDIF